MTECSAVFHCFAEDILTSVSDIDIPGYLSQRLNEERYETAHIFFFDGPYCILINPVYRDTETRRRKEKSEQSHYLNLRVVTEDEMVLHQVTRIWQL